jgi:DNA polymerase-1
LVYRQPAGIRRVYDLEVEGHHNFIASEICVHNCKAPNFQNLPREDKRVKSCIVARPGKVFVAADMSQLEPRVFASVSQDERLMKCFDTGDDFYSVIGTEVFDKKDCTLQKHGDKFFGKKYPDLRHKSKTVSLSSTYGTTANKMAPVLGIDKQEAQQIIDNYFAKFPHVETMMLGSHEEAKKNGYVTTMFGRKRRIPEAMEIEKKFGNVSHSELPYEARNLLNLACNHKIQSAGASIMNRSATAFCHMVDSLAENDPRWAEVKLVLQVHDSLVAESPEEIAEDVSAILKDALENTVQLKGVALQADPVICKSLAEEK